MWYDDLPKLETWVDLSHALHEGMRVQTGGLLSYGVGIIHGKRTKQKLNTKGTTKSALVAGSKYVPYKNHMINIVLGQGYALHQKVLYQDS